MLDLKRPYHMTYRMTNMRNYNAEASDLGLFDEISKGALFDPSADLGR